MEALQFCGAFLILKLDENLTDEMIAPIEMESPQCSEVERGLRM